LVIGASVLGAISVTGVWKGRDLVSAGAIPQILGGDESEDSEYPSCLAIANDDGYFCSGTLVSQDRVLTAAHCLEGREATKVLVGKDAHKPSSVVDVACSVLHPEYTNGKPLHDLAVLVLESDVSSPEPAELAPPEVVASSESVVLVGYGESYELLGPNKGRRRHVSVSVLSSECSAVESETYGCGEGLEMVTSSVSTVGLCAGDSGGPAFVELGVGKVALAGVNSRSVLGVGGCGGKAVLPRPDRYSAWIQSVGCGEEG